jgi:hypothetical protein
VQLHTSLTFGSIFSDRAVTFLGSSHKNTCLATVDMVQLHTSLTFGSIFSDHAFTFLGSWLKNTCSAIAR